MARDPSTTMKVPDRIAWVVDLLDVAPDDQILELGPGSGVAVALVAARLDGGRVTAIDRSATAIERTRHRNVGHVEAGRVALEQVELADYQGAPSHFDKAFGVDVNLFWTTSADAEGTVLARVLRPAGLLRLVYDGPAPGGARDVGPAIAANLERHGFATEVRHSPTGRMLCVTGRLRP
jgi:protein-L-isoaspartate O-methyltransferase